MSESWLELAIIGFIIAGIAVAIFKGGAANPETTGSLGRQVRDVKTKVGILTGKVDEIERQVVGLESSSAKSFDLQRMECDVAELKREVGNLRESVAAQHADIEHTRRQVDRLYDFIVERGMSK